MKLAKRGKHQERVGLDATSKAEKRRTYKEGPGNRRQVPVSFSKFRVPKWRVPNWLGTPVVNKRGVGAISWREPRTEGRNAQFAKE